MRISLWGFGGRLCIGVACFDVLTGHLGQLYTCVLCLIFNALSILEPHASPHLSKSSVVHRSVLMTIPLDSREYLLRQLSMSHPRKPN
jgi:hypothetical protein